MADTRLSRRSFLKSSAVGTAGLVTPGLLGANAARAAGSAVVEHLGVALYTVRDQMTTDAAGTLKAIADLGYRYVEAGLLPALGPALKAVGLRQASAYAPTYLVTGNRKAWAGSGDLVPESYDWSKAIDDAKSQGLEYLVIVYLMRGERGGSTSTVTWPRGWPRRGRPAARRGSASPTIPTPSSTRRSRASGRSSCC